MTCCFFGHSDCPFGIRPIIRVQIEKMMEESAKVKFYVGNHGQFDGMVRGIMKELISKGKKVDYSVVLAYIPGQKYEFDLPDQYADTIYPDGLENVPQRFAICKRNDWMIDNSDTVICYVVNHFGGAYTYTEKARRKGKRIINIRYVDEPIGDRL